MIFTDTGSQIKKMRVSMGRQLLERSLEKLKCVADNQVQRWTKNGLLHREDGAAGRHRLPGHPPDQIELGPGPALRPTEAVTGGRIRKPAVASSERQGPGRGAPYEDPPRIHLHAKRNMRDLAGATAKCSAAAGRRERVGIGE